MEVIANHRRFGDRQFRRRAPPAPAPACGPCGRPAAGRSAGRRGVRPHGSEIAGCPERLNGCVQRSISVRTASAPPLTGMVAAPIGGAGIASAGQHQRIDAVERAVDFARDQRLAAQRADVVLGHHVARHLEPQPDRRACNPAAATRACARDIRRRRRTPDAGRSAAMSSACGSATSVTMVAPRCRSISMVSQHARLDVGVEPIEQVARRARRGAVPSSGAASSASPTCSDCWQQRVVEQPRVGDRRGERADVIELTAQRHDAGRGDLSPLRLEADDAARGGGNANRAAGIGADRAERHAGCDRDGRSAARAAGRARRIDADCAPARTRSPRWSCRTRTRAGWSCRRTPRRLRAGACVTTRIARRRRDPCAPAIPRWSARPV